MNCDIGYYSGVAFLLSSSSSSSYSSYSSSSSSSSFSSSYSFSSSSSVSPLPLTSLFLSLPGLLILVVQEGEVGLLGY